MFSTSADAGGRALLVGDAGKQTLWVEGVGGGEESLRKFRLKSEIRVSISKSEQIRDVKCNEMGS
jgi:hypothetical protein